jgi:hypothetical protein
MDVMAEQIETTQHNDFVVLSTSISNLTTPGIGKILIKPRGGLPFDNILAI